MKTSIATDPIDLSCLWRGLLIVSLVFAFWAMLGITHAQAPTPTPSLFVSINGGGRSSFHANGLGSIFQYTLAQTQSTFASSLSKPRGIVFDSIGNLFVATSTYDLNSDSYQGAILKFTPDGNIDLNFHPTGFGTSVFLEGLVMDSAGNLFVVAENANDDNRASTIYKVTSDGIVSPFGVQSDCFQYGTNLNCSIPGGGFGLAFDRDGNLLVADGVSNDQTIWKFSPGGDTRSRFAGPESFTMPSSEPVGLAFDASGNLFVSTTTQDRNGNDAGAILEFTPDYNPYASPPTGTMTTFFNPLTGEPRGLAFDAAGNLFVAEPGSSFGDPTLGDLLKFTPEGAQTLWASGFANFTGPNFVAFPPNTLQNTTRVMVPLGTVGSSNTNIALTFPNVTVGGTTMATPIDPSSAGMLPAGYTALGTDANNLNFAFDITTTAQVGSPIIIAYQLPNPPGPDVSTLQVFHNEGGTLVNATCPSPRPGPTPDETTNTVFASVTSFSPFMIAKRCQIPTSITSNFNGTRINSGNYIWFNGVLKPSGLGSSPVTIHFTQQTITSANFTLSVPDASVTFDPNATSATRSFSNGAWVTRVPSSGLAGNTFLSGLGYQVPTNLPGGIRNVTWSGTMNSDTPGVSVQWKWAAAVYTSFSSGYNALGVKPVDDNRASQYQNSDHAGTPENFKSHVTGGATGGGGSNYTGAYGGTANVGPCP